MKEPDFGCMIFGSSWTNDVFMFVLFPVTPVLKLDFPFELKFTVVPPFLRPSAAFEFWFDPHAKRS